MICGMISECQAEGRREGRGEFSGVKDRFQEINLHVAGILQKRNRRKETIATLIRADSFLSKYLRIHIKQKVL